MRVYFIFVTNMIELESNRIRIFGFGACLFCIIGIVEQAKLYRVHYATISSNIAFWNNKALKITLVCEDIRFIFFSKVEVNLVSFDAPFDEESEYGLKFYF
jgi:hypothetical protein